MKTRVVCCVLYGVGSVVLVCGTILILLTTNQNTASTKFSSHEKASKLRCHANNEREITFHNNIQLSCTIAIEYLNTTLEIAFIPVNIKDSWAEPEVRHFTPSKNSSSDNDVWKMFSSVNEDVVLISVSRKPVTCAGATKYRVDIQIDVEKCSFYIDIEIEVSEISFHFSHDTQRTEGVDRNLSYGVTCSLHSGCVPIPIMLGIQNDIVTTPMYDVNLTCISLYSKEEGWFTECFGVVLEASLMSASSLSCFPVWLEQNDVRVREATFLTSSLLLAAFAVKCPQQPELLYKDATDCRLYHRCTTGQILVTYLCGRDKYFDSVTCACQNHSEVSECDRNGHRKKEAITTTDVCIPT